MTLSYRDVADILKIIDSSTCEELILELEGARLVVRRGGARPAEGAAATRESTAPANPAPVSQPRPAPSNKPSANEHDAPRGDAVCSPMVGTFYSRPSPDDPPFVETGSRVSPGDPLCLIEVMKLYTTVEASTSGVIEAVLVNDAELVEFDQPLFVIRTD